MLFELLISSIVTGVILSSGVFGFYYIQTEQSYRSSPMLISYEDQSIYDEYIDAIEYADP